MKKCLLLSVVLLVFLSFPAFGQSYEDLNNEYIKLKNRPSPNGDNTQPIVVVASAVRNDDGTVRVSILTDAGDVIPEFTVQAINSEKRRQPGGEDHKAGELNEISFKGHQTSEGRVYPIVIINAEPDADAVEIKFSVKNEDEPETSSAIILISDEAEITGIRIFRRP